MADLISASRPLTEEESTTLKSLLKSHLHLHNSPCAFQAEADADDLLSYAFELIEDGNSISYVCDEMQLMGLSICDDEVLEEVRKSLVMAIAKVNKKNWREKRVENNMSPTSVAAVSTSVKREVNSHASPPPLPQLSVPSSTTATATNPTAAAKPKLEPPKKTGNYLIDQMAAEEYKERLRRINQESKGEHEDRPMLKELHKLRSPTNVGVKKTNVGMVKAARSERRRRESIDDISVQYGAEKPSSLRVISTNNKESITTFTLKDRMASFQKLSSNVTNDTASISSSGSEYTYEEPAIQQRRTSWKEAANKDKDERKKKRNDAKKLNATRYTYNGGGLSSNKASSIRNMYQQSLNADKVESKLNKGGGNRRRESIDDINIQGFRSPASGSASGAAAVAAVAKEASKVDRKRRTALQLIMRDKTLSKEERRVKMEEVRAKYSAKKSGSGEDTTAASSADPRPALEERKTVPLAGKFEETSKQDTVTSIDNKLAKYRATPASQSLRRITDESKESRESTKSKDSEAIRELQAKIEALTSQLAASKDEASKATAELESVDSELNITKLENAKYAQDMMRLRSENETTIKNVQAELEVERTRRTATESQLVIAKAKHTKQASLVQEIATLKAENEMQRTKVKELKKIVKRDALNEQLFMRQHEEIRKLKNTIAGEVTKTVTMGELREMMMECSMSQFYGEDMEEEGW